MKKLFLILTVILGCITSLKANSFQEEVEAENAVQNGGVVLQTNSNASGGDFIKIKNSAPTGSLEFSITTPSAGMYKLEIFTFNGGTDKFIDLSVNNGTASTLTLRPSVWAYQGLAKSTLVDVNLAQGVNTLTFTANTHDVLLDKITVWEHFNAYYVSAAGNDANAGTIDAPWKTLDKASAISETSNNGGLLTPGDRLLFRAGDTFEGNLYFKASGDADRDITISSYGPGELPIISGSGNISGGDYFEAVKLTNASYLTLENLWIKNDRKNNTRYTWGETNSYGIRVIANKWGGVVSNLHFQDLKFSDIYGVNLPEEFNDLSVTGLRFESEANEPNDEVTIADVTIERCYFTHIGKAGVWAIHKGDLSNSDDAVNRNRNFVIANNTFYQTGGSGVILSKMYNSLVENNEFLYTGYSNATESRLVGRGSGMWVFKCINVIGQYNKALGVRGPNDSYGMHIDFGNKNIIYQYNYFEDSEGGFVEVLGDNHNVAYRFNVSVNDGIRDYHGSTIWTSGYVGTGNTPVPSNGVYVYNNTIYVSKNIKPDFSIFSEDTYIYNNIFYQTGSGIIGENVSIDIRNNGDFLVENNLFQGNIASAFKNHGVNSLSGNPALVNPLGGNPLDYAIQNSSPVIDEGKSFPEPSFPMAGQGIFQDISADPIVDINGNAIDVSNLIPNIGADNSFNSGFDASSIRVTSVSLENLGNLYLGTDVQATATVLPTNATNKGVTWQIADTSIATVDSNGLVTPVAVGSTILKVTTEDRGYEASVTVKVVASFEVNLSNGDFENNLTGWNSWNNPQISSDAVYGNNAVELDGPASVNQWVAVEPNTTYTLTGFAKVLNPSSDRVVFGVNDHNNNGIANAQIYDTSYTKHHFTFTTSAATDSVKVFFWRPGNGVGKSYIDEIELKKTAYAINAGFEKDLHGWTTWGSGTKTTETVSPYQGNASLKIVGNGGANQFIKTEPATTYEISFVAKVDDASKPASIKTASSSNNLYNSMQISDTAYTQHSFVFTTNAGDDETKIGFWRSNSATDGIYLDAVSLTKVSIANKNIAKNGKNIAEDVLINNTLLYPNPASGSVTLNTTTFEGLLAIAIFDTVGIEVASYRDLSSDNDALKLDIAALPSGTYYVVIIDKNQKKETLKLVVL